MIINGAFVNATAYRSPARLSTLARIEDELLARDHSWWTGRRPLYKRAVAEVPRALYLNCLVSKSQVAALAPDLFVPIDLQADDASTLFTVLLFELKNARPLWAPRILGALVPEIMQSNWRFYGQITESARKPRKGVLFVRTVTASLLLSAFGRRLARCFPLRRARQMILEQQSSIVHGIINPGRGTAPQLLFVGERADPGSPPHIFREQFSSYESYARWIIDQHLSLVIWPREYVVQDMHLDFQHAKITRLQPQQCRISGLSTFQTQQPFDSFFVERLVAFLDSIVSGSR